MRYLKNYHSTSGIEIRDRASLIVYGRFVTKQPHVTKYVPMLSIIPVYPFFWFVLKSAHPGQNADKITDDDLSVISWIKIG